MEIYVWDSDRSEWQLCTHLQHKTHPSRFKVITSSSTPGPTSLLVQHDPLPGASKAQSTLSPKSGPCVTYTATGQVSPVRSAWTKGPRRNTSQSTGRYNQKPQREKNLSFNSILTPHPGIPPAIAVCPFERLFQKPHHHPCQRPAAASQAKAGVAFPPAHSSLQTPWHHSAPCTTPHTVAFSWTPTKLPYIPYTHGKAVKL